MNLLDTSLIIAEIRAFMKQALCDLERMNEAINQLRIEIQILKENEHARN